MTDVPRSPAAVPESLTDIAEVLGLGLVLSLMAHFGGQEIEFPKRVRRGHELARILGQDQAEALCHLMSGQRLYIPHGKPLRRQQQVKQMELTGRGRREIAKVLGLSQRHVRRLANQPPAQLPLFPED